MERPETPELAQAHIAQIIHSKGFDAKSGALNCNVDDLEAALDILSADLYQQSTHFLLEVIQNADDCSYTNGESPTLDITYWNGRLRLDYNEDGFRKRDVDALCRISKSSKSTSEFQIGEKGIGFKSVFRVANVVWIHSYNYSFQFDTSRKLGMITPKWEEFPGMPRDNFTSILLQVPKGDDQGELIREMKSMTPKCMMFLRRLRQINISVDAEGGNPWKTSLVRDDPVTGVKSYRKTTLRQDGKALETYHIIQHHINSLSSKLGRGHVAKPTIELALPVTVDEVEPVIESQQVYAFLPIRDYGFKFLLHANFQLTANRQDIVEPSRWNKVIVDSIEDALLDAVQLLNKSNLRYKWPRYLPIPMAFANVFSELNMKMLSQSPVLESEEKGWIAPISARYVPPSLRDKYNQPLILSPKTKAKYLSLQYAHSDWEYIRNLGAQQLSDQEFLEDLQEFATNSDSIMNQPDQWHAELAKALEPLLETFRKELTEIPLIPLNDGRWVSMSASTIFFPGERVDIPKGIEVSQLRLEVEKYPTWASFFKNLGVKPFEVAELQQQVLITHLQEDLSHIPRPALISQAVFLFRTEWKSGENASKFWVATEVGPLRRASDVYMDAPWPHSASQYLDKRSDKFNFLHESYHNAVGPDEVNEWFTWLHEQLGMCHLPRLVNSSKDTARFSPDMQYILDTQPSRKFLALLRDNWGQYKQYFLTETSDRYTEYLKVRLEPGLNVKPPRFLSPPLIVDQLASAMVSCLNSKSHKLCDTFTVPFLPHGLSPETQSLQPLLDVPEPEDPKWEFLEMFCVTVRDGINTYLSTLRGIRGSEVPTDFVSWLYDNIQSRTDKDNLGAVRELFKGNSIHIPGSSGGVDSRWVKESECVWNGPNYLRKFHMLNKIYPGKAKLFEEVLTHPRANFEVLVSEVEDITKSTPLPWITNVFKDINKRLRAEEYESGELCHLSRLIPMEIFPVNHESAETNFGNLCSGTIETEWYIADRLHLRSSFQGVIPLLAFTVGDILEMMPLILKSEFQSRLLSKAAVSKLITEGEVHHHEEYTKIFREKSEFFVRMIPMSTHRGLRLQNALDNLNVFVADRVLLRWTVTSIGSPSKSKVESHLDDGLRGVVLPPSGEKGIEVYLQRGFDSGILPIEVADQLATICGIDHHASLIYIVLTHSDNSTIASHLDRRGIPSITKKASSEVQGKPADAGDSESNAVPKSSIEGKIESVTNNEPTQPKYQQKKGVRKSGDKHAGSQSQTQPKSPQKKIEQKSDEKQARIENQTQPKQPPKNTEQESGEKQARSENQAQPEQPPKNTEQESDDKEAKPDNHGISGPVNIPKVAKNPNNNDGMTNVDNLFNTERESDQPEAPSAKANVSRKIYRPPPAQPPLPGISEILLQNTPEIPLEVLHTNVDTVKALSGNKEVTSSKSLAMFERPRIVGSPNVVFVSSPQELPAENFSDGARGGKILPARARISESGACIVSVAVNPDIGSDPDTVFLGELFVSKLLEKYLRGSYHARDHWTSHLRTWASHPPLEEHADVTTTFTLKEVPEMTEFLAHSSFKEARHWKRQTPVYYIQAQTTRGGRDSPFTLSAANLERIRKCNASSLARAAPEEVFILVLVSDIDGDALASWFINPWSMYASGEMVVRLEKDSYVAKIEAAEPVLAFTDSRREVRKLSGSNKHDSLRSVFPNFKSAQSRSQEIFHQPGLIDDGQFVYQPLPSGNSRDIRLLELFQGHGRKQLRGAIHHVRLGSEEMRFKAMSYVWGHSLKPFILRTRQGSIGLTASLYFGLRRVRKKDSSVFIWADAICIDQSNSQEKSHQIRLMPEIYQTAEHVFAWLGYMADDSDKAIKYLCELGMQSAETSAKTAAAASTSEESPIWDSINRFFGRAWFYRVWIVQELVLAPNVTLLCGDLDAQWNDIYNAAKICAEKARQSTAAIMTPIAQKVDVILSLGDLKQSYHEGDGGQRELLALFQRFQHTRATLQRDKLFAFLGLANNAGDPDLDPDYDEPLEVIVQRYARTFVKRGSAMDLLYRAGYSSPRFPSWIPDWVTNVQRQTITTWPSKPKEFSACTHVESSTRLSSVDDSVLVAKGYIVDRIKIVGQTSFQLSDLTLYLKEIFSTIKSLQSYPNGESLEDLVWKIPIGDAEKPPSGSWENFNFSTSYQAFTSYLQLGEWLTGSETEAREINALYKTKQFLFEPQELRKSMWLFLYTAQEFAKRFTDATVCVTRGGYVGIVPRGAKKGDIVSVLHGSAVPFLMSKSERRRDHYVHLGECYIHGIMHGQHGSFEDLEELEIRLH